jgi:7-cyano-7-deazaguanine synthase
MVGQEDTRRAAVVLLSGGLDSATVAAWLQREGFHVIALTVDYGQRQRAELAAAEAVVRELGLPEHLVLPLDLRAIGGSALTGDQEVPKAATIDAPVAADIPVTYVPARNTILLSLALALAEARGAHDLGIGVNALDYSGYPDCRPDFVAKFGELANLATREGVEGRPFTLHTPLLERGKDEILALAYELGVPVDATLSCYDPDADGSPCGRCDACRLRHAAVAAWESRHPAEEVTLEGGVAPHWVWPPRHRNLRRGQPFHTARYDEVDFLPTTWHMLLRLGGRPVGCATLMADPREPAADGPYAGGPTLGLRLRGMAVDPEFRGRGFGRMLMEACQEESRRRGTGLWCNARVGAIPHYLACGYQRVGEEFEMPAIGPHYMLEWRAGG